MEWKFILGIVFTVLIFSSSPVVQFKNISTIMINTTNYVTYFLSQVIPYNHGVVVALVSHYEYYWTAVLPAVPYNVSLYFVNGSEDEMFFNSTIINVQNITVTVFKGDLYLMVQWYYDMFPKSESNHTGYISLVSVYVTNIYVFHDLKLVKNYSVSGYYSMTTYTHKTYNLTVIRYVNLTNNTLVSNVTVSVNDHNFTFPSVERIEQLPYGVLVISDVGKVQNSSERVLNFTFINQKGIIEWSRNYTFNYLYHNSTLNFLGIPTPKLPIAVLGNQLFVINGSFEDGNLTEDSIINATIISIDLLNGTITREIKLLNVPPIISLYTIGGNLYVVSVGQTSVTVEEYSNNGSLIKVYSVPVETREYEKGVTEFFYDPGTNLLIINQCPQGANVTDIYAKGVIHYTLSEDVSDYELYSGLLLVRDNNYYTLAYLNSNGTISGLYYLGPIDTGIVTCSLTFQPIENPPSPVLYLIEKPEILATYDPASHNIYIVKIFTIHSTNNGENALVTISVYELGKSTGEAVTGNISGD